MGVVGLPNVVRRRGARSQRGAADGAACSLPAIGGGILLKLHFGEEQHHRLTSPLPPWTPFAAAPSFPPSSPLTRLVQGKSTFFNLLCNMSVPAENYPFCTVRRLTRAGQPAPAGEAAPRVPGRLRVRRPRMAFLEAREQRSAYFDGDASGWPIMEGAGATEKARSPPILFAASADERASADAAHARE
jgi:hypothetical protein